MTDQVRWEFGRADDFRADLQDERAFNESQGAETDAIYKSLNSQFDGGARTGETTSLNSGHMRLHDEVDGGSASALGGLDDMQNSQMSGMNRAISRLQG